MKIANGNQEYFFPLGLRFEKKSLELDCREPQMPDQEIYTFYTYRCSSNSFNVPSLLRSLV